MIIKIKDLVVDEQIAFAHKSSIDYKTKKIGFVDIHDHPFTTNLYPSRKDKNIYVVLIKPIKKGIGDKSPYYGTLEDDEKFKFIYPMIQQTKICFPYDVTFKLYNLSLEEIGVITNINDINKDLSEIEIKLL